MCEECPRDGYRLRDIVIRKFYVVVLLKLWSCSHFQVKVDFKKIEMSDGIRVCANLDQDEDHDPLISNFWLMFLY